MNLPKQKNYLLIDSSYLIYRSHFAYKKISFQSKPIGAFFGFVKTISFLLKQIGQVEGVVFAFDLPKPTWRHQAFPEYKANRDKPDPSMIEQIPIIQKWCRLVSPNCFSSPGYEADDIIATICTNNSLNQDKNFEKTSYIFSADKDLYQLLTKERTKIIINSKQKISFLEKSNFVEKNGITADQWIDYKVLVGDASDNLPGILGIGPKTAVLILQEFGSLENLKKCFNQWEQKSIFQDSESWEKSFENTKILKAAQDINQNWTQTQNIKHLCSLQQVPEITLQPEGFEFEKGQDMLKEYHFNSLIPKKPSPDSQTNSKSSQYSPVELF